MDRQDLIKKLDSIIEIGIVNAKEDKAVLAQIREELQKPVLIITSGGYSDYHIVGVSFDFETADRVSKHTYDSNGIDVYVPIEFGGKSNGYYDNDAYMEVKWDPTNNEITLIEIDSYHGTSRLSCGIFCFYVDIRSREAIDALEKGKCSHLLKKVAQDKYAEYKASKLEKE